MNSTRIGFGYDIHRLVKGDNITLGGVSFKSNKKILAHSDGDIVLHSLSNAILSSIGLNDIGTYFKDTSNDTLNLDSKKILSFALEKLNKENYTINNVVITIITQTPKINPIVNQLIDSISKLLSVETKDVAIHAGTKEKLDSVGKGRAIECYSVISIVKRG